MSPVDVAGALAALLARVEALEATNAALAKRLAWMEADDPITESLPDRVLAIEEELGIDGD